MEVSGSRRGSFRKQTAHSTNAFCTCLLGSLTTEGTCSGMHSHGSLCEYTLPFRRHAFHKPYPSPIPPSLAMTCSYPPFYFLAFASRINITTTISTHVLFSPFLLTGFKVEGLKFRV